MTTHTTNGTTPSRIPARIAGSKLPPDMTQAEAREAAERAGREAAAAFVRPSNLAPPPKEPEPMRTVNVPRINPVPKVTTLQAALMEALRDGKPRTKPEIKKAINNEQVFIGGHLLKLCAYGYATKHKQGRRVLFAGVPSAIPADLASITGTEEEVRTKERTPRASNKITGEVWTRDDGDVVITCELAFVARSVTKPDAAPVVALDKAALLGLLGLRPSAVAPASAPVVVTTPMPTAPTPPVTPAPEARYEVTATPVDAAAPTPKATKAKKQPAKDDAIKLLSDEQIRCVLRKVCGAMSKAEVADGITIQHALTGKAGTVTVSVADGAIIAGMSGEVPAVVKQEEEAAKACALLLFKRAFPKAGTSSKDGKTSPALQKMQDRAIMALVD